MSQLLQRIEDELRSVYATSDRGKLLARKSAYLARIGRFENAKSIVNELRQEFAENNSSTVTIWIMLTEGLIHYYENLSDEAKDRIVRAQLLSKALGEADLAATTSAWRAHMEFERSDFRAMTTSLESAFSFMTPSNLAAQTRVSMVLSDCHFLCGNREKGQKWFMRGRATALKEGDQASIEALLYNKAAFALAWLRAQSCFGVVDSDQLSLVRLELASARNLQDMTGIAALTHVVHLCEARLLLLEGKYDQGSSKLQLIRSAAPYGDYNFNQSLIDLELEYCKHKLDLARVNEAVPIWSFDSLDIDEQLIAAWMISEIFSHTADASEFDEISRRLNEKKSEYSRVMLELRSLLARFENA